MYRVLLPGKFVKRPLSSSIEIPVSFRDSRKILGFLQDSWDFYKIPGFLGFPLDFRIPVRFQESCKIPAIPVRFLLFLQDSLDSCKMPLDFRRGVRDSTELFTSRLPYGCMLYHIVKKERRRMV